MFEKNDKIFFIDASFSKYNNEGNVLFDVDNIYRDISLMTMHLKVDKPLFKPWMFLRSNKEIEEAFISGYFGDKHFDEKQCLLWENIAIKNNIAYYRNSDRPFLNRYSRIFLLNILKFINNFKIKL